MRVFGKMSRRNIYYIFFAMGFSALIFYCCKLYNMYWEKRIKK
ncbi:hypothetical protein HMPREF1984_00702 [Leptotrichia sp. oral taxon 215 str. W9775]|nr:hypothetical protein HMPREF1984_00702 [Leptotrichia sp. oral taxon 215 str. W9775]